MPRSHGRESGAKGLPNGAVRLGAPLTMRSLMLMTRNIYIYIHNAKKKKYQDEKLIQ